MYLENNTPLDLHNPKPTPVSIKQLCEQKVSFRIPSYQRGYKWGKREIVALLDDLSLYEPKKDGNFYCLQPIVVRWDSSQRVWRVIDGQQRLTTIYIILQFDDILRNCFELTYERETKLNCLSDGNVKIVTDDSESFHISSAFEIIAGWSKENGNDLNHLINLIRSGATKFIWYKLNTPDGEAEALKIEHSYFMNLNSGKIGLTEAELIKALLLHKNNPSGNEQTEFRQTFMAEEWDRMERSLRQTDVWRFIAGREEIPLNAMDKLMDLLWRSLDKEETKKYDDYEYPIFSWAERQVPAELWKHIVHIFRLIMGWFDDCEMHNLIGYFASGKDTGDIILDILRKRAPFPDTNVNQPSKDELLAELWTDTLTHKGLICNTENGALPQEISFEAYHNYRYDKNEKNKIFNILLLANIVNVTLNGEPRKFDFVRFNTKGSNKKNGLWNVEHISPANPKSNQELKKMLEEVLDERRAENFAGELPPEIKRLLALLRKIDFSNAEENTDELTGLDEKEREEFLDLRRKLLPGNYDDNMTIDNLTLLTERCNKGISNRFFFDKRQRLQGYQAEGQYIPLLSLHVFTKWYSPKNDFPWFWTDEDKKPYLAALDSYIRKIIEHIQFLKSKI